MIPVGTRCTRTLQYSIDDLASRAATVRRLKMWALAGRYRLHRALAPKDLAHKFAPDEDDGRSDEELNRFFAGSFDEFRVDPSSAAE